MIVLSPHTNSDDIIIRHNTDDLVMCHTNDDLVIS